MSGKRHILMLSVLVFFLIVTGYVVKTKRIDSYHDCIEIQKETTDFSVNIFFDKKEQLIYPWYDSTTGIWEVFLPSYLNLADEIKCYMGSKDIEILDALYEKNGVVLQNKVVYKLVLGGEIRNFRINLSDNISTLFIDTQSGSMHNLEESKENKEKGMIYSIASNGNIEYMGAIDSISGHGNGSWSYEKKPYSIELIEDGELAGLNERKSWKLLALHYEGDKIHSKIAYELERILGGKIPAECTWVDVFFNGHYNGIYLLIDSIKGREEFQFEKDGFLLEKEIKSRLEDECFETKHNAWFVVKERGEDGLNKINDQIQMCEDVIYDQLLDEAIIDIDSFAIQFLVNLISMNYDAFKTSSYYYKLDNDNKIYSGPSWDFDGAFAELLHQGENWVNPEGNIFEGEERLEWYKVLYDNPMFYERVIQLFLAHYAEINELVNGKIGEYASYIQTAVDNDNIRWKFTDGTIYRAGTYQTWENDVRYLEYFLNRRLEYLADNWELAGKQFEWESSGELHTVYFKIGNSIVETKEIIDGNVISQLPDSKGKTWCFEYSGEAYYNVLPILEDCVLILP